MVKIDVYLGKNIRLMRRKMGLTMEELAEKVDVSYQTISKWENDEGNPTVMALIKLLNIFNVTADDLLFGNNLDIYNIESIVRSEAFKQKTPFIRTINKKGFYTIVELDLEEFFPIFRFDFSLIVAIVKCLNNNGYKVVELFDNGFGIYFNSNEDAIKFPKLLYNIIDELMHAEDYYSVKVYEKEVDDAIWSIKATIVDETLKNIWPDSKYYWIDNAGNIRGYGKSKKECMNQIEKQKCEKYEIFENGKE